MFKKALAHQSNATPIRSSARRQLVSSLFTQYPSLHESVAAEGEEAAGKMSEKDLGRVLVPDGVRSANFETSAGVEGVRLSPSSLPASPVTSVPTPSFLLALLILRPLPPSAPTRPPTDNRQCTSHQTVTRCGCRSGADPRTLFLHVCPLSAT